MLEQCYYNMNVFTKLFEENTKIIDEQPTESPKLTLMSNKHSSFVEKFKIPYNESVEWDKTVGRPEIERLGLCGRILADEGKAYLRRGNSLVNNLGACTQQEWNWLHDEVYTNQRFCDTVCVQEKGHTGDCSFTPYRPQEFKGEVLKGSWTHEGAKPNPFCNRGARRNCLTMFDSETEKSLRQKNKEMGLKEENLNLGIVLSKGASKYMCGLAHIDILAVCFHISDAEICFKDVPDTFKDILKTRWKELVDFYKGNCIIIENEQGNYQDPMDWKTPVTVNSFGGKGNDSMQFGHVDPVSEQEWKTRPNNVLPLFRRTNLMQSNNSVKETLKHFQKMGAILTERFGEID